MYQINEEQELEEFAELQCVRLHRVYTDPVITHNEDVAWGFGEIKDLQRHILIARLKRLRTVPFDEPIVFATVPEAVAYLASATMHAGAATGTVPALYHLAMREYAEEFDVYGPEWLGNELETEDFYRCRLHDLRKAIMREQNQEFISERFDDLDLQWLSKSFWNEGVSPSTNVQ